ncbi:putative bifunctional diguanylate cyclase/phosphodiesterase [Paenibacillus radicis (ex Xue et al. 2023)]|uniref:EAL domain-containing protein n=1 Tax=Paenibacillus radicis (ex Xue et al. 2023) TaxID=2972489 RepID=A0ABT1YJF9_9BACL|nr:EAL domain-containing protein [Paenibacillus radicis (ex Xue et al. 2023)]MCR8633294.1 EAL domain-containing protein [Paenibacillus radicis (ex Xue et al. 2023)]
MRKAAGTRTVPSKYYVPFLVYFSISVWMAWRVQHPLAWGFCIITFFVLAGFIYRNFWIRSNVKDISEPASIEGKKALEDGLVDSGALFESLFRHNPNVVCIIDVYGMITKVNGNIERIIGYNKHELENSHFYVLLCKESVNHTLERLSDARKGEPQSFRTMLQHKEGYRVDLDITAAPIQDGTEVNGVIVIGQDITARKRTEEQIRHMAYYDDMTGLPNRRLFMTRLNEAIASAVETNQLVAVFYLDIDRFKIINESFGHDYGDMLLLQLGERFTRCITDKDYLARTEGDEFALFFSGLAHPGQVNDLAKSIRQVLEEPFSYDQYQLHITASIGVAILSQEEQEDAASLTKCADIALTRAKEKGKNNYQVFNSEMKTISLKRLTMENELRKALLQNELILHYQPQMDIVSGNIVGFEALIRWRHPERGMVSPMDFIPFAEESGLIVPIGEWVLREACRQNKLWQNLGYPHLPVSVNISTRQFLQPNLCAQVAEVLESTGLDPSYLELEITESSTMDVDYAIGVLLELKELGIKISIDDFGTGYSSLSYLKRFPIDKLKIDQSFVRDIMTDPNDAAIVASIIAMTRHMNLKVIAEGVETEEQLGFLHLNNCNEIQGYFFSRPLAAEQLEMMLMNHQQAAATRQA